MIIHVYVLYIVADVFRIEVAGLCLGSSNLAGLVALNATVSAKKRATCVGLASCRLDATAKISGALTWKPQKTRRRLARERKKRFSSSSEYGSRKK